jgi:hypothetical protein
VSLRRRSAQRYMRPTMKSNWGAEMLLRTFVHLTTETVVVAIALMLALPFFLALSSPFIGG